MQARMQGGLVQGSAQAETASSHVQVGSQSAVLGQDRTRLMTDINSTIIENNAMKEAYGYHSKAAGEYQEAAYAERAGELGAASSVVGGIGQLAKILGPLAIGAA
jgi:hypothetical protein